MGGDSGRFQEETPVKRRRLNTDTGSEQSPWSIEQAPQPTNGESHDLAVYPRSNSGRPPWHFPIFGPPGDDKKYTKRPGFQYPPPLPSRPGKHVQHDVFASSRTEKDRSIPKREVETTPYKMVAPGDAPFMHDKGKSLLCS